MCDHNALVHTKAIESFTQFAESTPHETLVPECIGSKPFLQDMVVAYLNKVNSYLNPSFTDGTDPHETLVPECIGSKPFLKDLVVAYLN